MKRTIGIVAAFIALSITAFAQEKNEKNEEQSEAKTRLHVPAVVKEALAKQYPQATKVAWEKENGNYEANWGGKSGEDHSVQFTPAGNFIEMVNTIPVSQIPKSALTYIAAHYKGEKVTEAGKVTDASGKLSYEVEVHGKDIIFDENGAFVKEEK
jgi:hypothetical protein